MSKNVPPKDYSLSSSKSEKVFDAFLSVSILASVFGNGILPEIQVLNAAHSELPLDFLVRKLNQDLSIISLLSCQINTFLVPNRMTLGCM